MPETEPDRSPWRARGPLVLSGCARLGEGLVFETAPMQVVDRVEELGLVGELSPWGRRLLTVVSTLRLRRRDGDVLRPPAQGEGRAWEGA